MTRAGFGDSIALNHRVIVPDVRGHGQSDKPTAPGSYGPRMADDVVALLDHLRLRRAHLVGHSMGAVIAAFVAVRHPDRVSSASLVAGPFYPDSVAAIRETGRFAEDMEQGRGYTAFITWVAPGIPPQTAAQIAAQIAAGNDPPRMAPIFRSVAGLMNREAPARQIPAFFVVGTNDPLDSLSVQLHSRWRGAMLLRIEGAGHVDVIMRPQAIAGVRRTIAEGR